MLYTANFKSYIGCPGMPYCVSQSMPKWVEMMRLRTLAPTWDMIYAYKGGALQWEKFKIKYFEILKQRHNTLENIIKIARTGNIILVCWEKPNQNCHRHLIVQYCIEQLGLEPEFVCKEVV